MFSFTVDWNCNYLPTLSGTASIPPSAIASMREAYEKFGFQKFLLTTCYSPSQPISVHLLKRKLTEAALKNLPKPLKAKIASYVVLTPGLSEWNELDRLQADFLHRLLLEFPLSAYEDWMDTELNRLLYQKKFPLRFLSFERAVLLFPSEVVKRLLRIQTAEFQFSYASLQNPRVLAVISELLAQNRPVFLGSVDANRIRDVLDFTEISLQNPQYIALFKQNHGGFPR